MSHLLRQVSYVNGKMLKEVALKLRAFTDREASVRQKFHRKRHVAAPLPIIFNPTNTSLSDNNDNNYN
jgi:hypothetical protein